MAAQCVAFFYAILEEGHPALRAGGARDDPALRAGGARVEEE